jgi:hypothetical protein
MMRKIHTNDLKSSIHVEGIPNLLANSLGHKPIVIQPPTNRVKVVVFNC